MGMTREEREDAINFFREVTEREVNNAKYSKLAIEALEQEPKSEWEYDHAILKAYSDGANEVLDVIRAEIEREIIPRNSDQYDHEAKWQNSGLRMALKVIDKYKAESEPQESDIEKRKPYL